MNGPPEGGDDPTLAALQAWMEREESVRAALLVGSRADPIFPVDALSDHDVLLFLAPDASLRDRDDWFAELGPVAVTIRDSVERPWGTVRTRLVQYRDGSRIDFTLSSTEELRRITRAGSLPPALDRGYRVLLDRDGLSGALPEPTGRAYLTRPPSEERYRDLVNEFWWETLYVAKHLARAEPHAARYNLECVLRFGCLVPALEWQVHVAGEGPWPAGPYGRGLEERLGPRDAERLRATCPGPSSEEVKAALDAMIDLFRDAAREVGEELGYAYPTATERDVGALLERIAEAGEAGATQS